MNKTSREIIDICAEMHTHAKKHTQGDVTNEAQICIISDVIIFCIFKRMFYIQANTEPAPAELCGKIFTEFEHPSFRFQLVMCKLCEY